MDEEQTMYEVEDFMCDQVIISTDVDFKTKWSTITISATKLRLAVAILADALLPTVVSVYYAYLRNQKIVVENVRRQVFPAIWAILANYLSKSLSSVHRGITYPLTLAQIRLTVESENSETDDTPEKSVECIVLNQPAEIKADVIFIHGLHGSQYKTWRQGSWRHEKHKLRHHSISLPEGDFNIRPRQVALKRTVSDMSSLKSSPNKIARRIGDESIDTNQTEDEDDQRAAKGNYPCWPEQWLPMDCPGVRVIALNYTTDPYLWRPVWVKKRNRTNMVERSREMIEHLLDIGVGEHPIIWVGHSKGGLFIKQIIIDSWQNFDESRIGDIYAKTKAILFYSVPHRGSILADFSLPLLRKSVELLEIQKNCPFVLDLHEKFMKLLEDREFNPKIFSFIETSFTLMSFIYLRIVTQESADPGFGTICGVPLDHREICKPAGRDCFLYRELVNLIESVLSSHYIDGTN